MNHKECGSQTPHSGQAVVEFALVLPLFLALIVLLIQGALVGRDEIAVTHAARAAVREASVTADGAQIRIAATRALPGAHVRVVRRGAPGQPVEVIVTYVARTDLPIVGSLLPDLTLSAHAVMAVER
ncbi:MAG TPA: TadE family protein [Acidimicrobiia bacterium]|nr:TadE family protein [Acidimicrobiia bacterium]